MRLPVVLAALVLAAVGAAWAWLGRPVPALPSPLHAGDKLPCVSYAPFRPGQSPFIEGLVIPAWQIDDDFERLSKITKCVRTYSTEMGLSVAPEMARKHGLTLLQGIWIGRNAANNAIEIREALKAANENPDVVTGVIVGNEVLLRGELSAVDLAALIRQVKSQTKVPVTYADVWEFWERNADLAKEVDFVTVHILPFWEDLPVGPDKAVAHIGEIREHVGKVFEGRKILIGETGWPSAGRMREAAEPSPSNQARVIQELLALAAQKGYDVNVIEAFDQPWKRASEGTVGGHWGFLDAYTRDFKFGWGQPVSDHPDWIAQALGGMALALAVFAAAWRAARPRAEGLSAAAWAGVAGIALFAGLAFPRAVAAAPVESLGWPGWTRAVVMLALGLAVPLLAAVGIGAGSRRVAFSTALDRVQWRQASGLERALAVALVLSVALIAQIAAGLVFDPRYKDFQFAGLTPIALGFLFYALVARSSIARHDRHAEWIAAGAFLLAGVFIPLNETLANWQALWTGALLVAFAVSLWLTSGKGGQRTG